MKIAFMGSPEFAAQVLAGVYAAKQHQIVCVVTQPDAVAGRGHQLQFNPVKKFALAHNLPVLQPQKISLDIQPLIAYQPDIIVTCAFGQILKQSVLDAAPHGVINVHGSLLPKYRGAAPIQWAVLNGDQVTGITIAQTELGLDCGPIICARETAIKPGETAGELFARLPELAIVALSEALDKIAAGTATFTPQDATKVSLAPMLNKDLAQLDWQRDAEALVNWVRGMNPWPVAYFVYQQAPIKVYQATALPGQAMPGQVVYADNKHGLVIGCGSGLLRIDTLQVAGKKVVSGKDFCNGRQLLGVQLA